MKNIMSGMFFFFLVGFLYILFNILQKKFIKIQQLKKRLSSLKPAESTTQTVSLFYESEKIGIFEEKIHQLLSFLKKNQLLKLWIHQTGLRISFITIIINVFSISTIIIGIIFYILNHSLSWIILNTFLINIGLTFMLLKEIRYRRQQKIIKELPIILNMINQFLKAGFNMISTLEECSKEQTGVLSIEIRKIIMRINSGIAYEDALRASAESIALKSYSIFTGALIIQHHIGASATLVIDNIIVAIQRRAELAAKVKILSSESVSTYFVLVAIQILLGGGLTYASPDRMIYFINNPSGRNLSFIILILLIGQFTLIKWVTRIKVD